MITVGKPTITRSFVTKKPEMSFSVKVKGKSILNNEQIGVIINSFPGVRTSSCLFQTDPLYLVFGSPDIDLEELARQLSAQEVP